MLEHDELAVPADVTGALAELYWLFPFTRTVADPRRPDRLKTVPLPPRSAPRRQIAAAAELLGQPIPDWVVALWCCKVSFGGNFADQEAGELGRFLVEIDRAAHEAGAPRSAIFFAGSANLYPGSECSSRNGGRRFEKGVLDSSIFGFDPADVGGTPRLICYLHTVAEPERRPERVELVPYLRARAHQTSLADDTDVYSKETYAGVLATRAAKRPPFRLRWETSTPGFVLPAPDPGPPQVRHARFGVGTVVAREGSGEAEKLTVAFADATRVILARFVDRVDPSP